MAISFHGKFSKKDLQATFGGLGRDISFIQIGAMDGVTHDPIHEFVKKHVWRGVLVEPVPEMFEALKKNYSGCPGLSFENCAIADYEGEIEMTRIDPAVASAGIFQTGAFGISTVMADRGVFGGNAVTREEQQIFLKHSQTLNVRCCRLKMLLEKYAVEKLDLLVIDAEGADWMIARQLPLEKYRPKAIYLEYVHLSPYEKTACAEHFRNNGYRIYLDEKNAENFLAVI